MNRLLISSSISMQKLTYNGHIQKMQQKKWNMLVNSNIWSFLSSMGYVSRDPDPGGRHHLSYALGIAASALDSATPRKDGDRRGRVADGKHVGLMPIHGSRHGTQVGLSFKAGIFQRWLSLKISLLYDGVWPMTTQVELSINFEGFRHSIFIDDDFLLLYRWTCSLFICLFMCWSVWA